MQVLFLSLKHFFAQSSIVSSAAVFWDVRQCSPKKQLLTTEPHSFVFVVCLHSVEQTNQITTKCEWCKILREKACGANSEGFLGFLALFHAARTLLKMGCLRATIMTDEKKMSMKLPSTSASCAHRCVQLMRVYNIFWKCLVVSVNQGLKASYRLKTGEKSGIQNSLSTNRAKLLDFLVPL